MNNPTTQESAISNAIPFLKTELTHMMEEMIRVLTRLGQMQENRMDEIDWPAYIENREPGQDYKI